MHAVKTLVNAVGAAGPSVKWGTRRFRAVFLTALFLAVSSGKAGPSLIPNGDFSAQRDGWAEGWNMAGKPARVEFEPAGGPQGRPAQRIETAGPAALEIARTLHVPAATTFLFRARLKTAALADITIGERRMAYTGGGDWQTIADFVKTDNQTALTIKVRFRNGSAAGTNCFWISDVELHEDAGAVLAPRSLYGPTTIVEQGRPAAVIVYPGGRPEYARLAAEVQAAVQEVSGVTLPMVTDRQATDPSVPVLGAPYRDSHLIIIGRLGINRALWPAYNRFLAAEDGYYPGGTGYVVRTAANVLRNGRNHLILGGSSDTGAARAVTRFAEILRKTPVADRTLTLPWLLDVQLDGPCRAAFDADDKLWTEDPHSSELPEPSPGYRTIIRWYMNAMGYYWSGRDSYRKRAVEYFLPVLEDKAYTHHYIVEFFVRTYDMLDDSGLFTPAQIAAADALILQNFREFTTGPDLGWMTLFSPPYDTIGVRNRHSISPWMGDLMMADFLHDYLKPQGDLADVVAYRRAEKHPFFQHLVGERWSSSLPNLNVLHDDEIGALLFRYALDQERYEFFERGNARRGLKIESLTASRTVASDDHFILGILASYYADGRYKTLLETTPPPERLFQNRYVCGVHRYRPGVELPSADPADFCGVHVPPMQPHDQKLLHACQFPMHQNPAIDPRQAFEYVVFRDGFGPESDLLKISGFGDGNGAINDLFSRGQRILAPVRGSAYGPLPDIYYNLNALSVVRTDRWMDAQKPYAGAARREWLANFGRPGGGIAFTIEPFMTTSWRREAIWLERGLFVVRDSVTALDDGVYSINVGWHSDRPVAWDGVSWTGQWPGLSCRFTPLGSDFRVAASPGADPETVLRAPWDGALRKGQTIVATMVLQIVPAGQSFYDAHLAASNELVLASSKAPPIAVLWGPVKRKDLDTDAHVAVVRPGRLDLMGATTCTAADGQRPLLNATSAVSARLDADAGTMLLDEGAEIPRTETLAKPFPTNALDALLTSLAAAPALARTPAPPPSASVAARLVPVDDTNAWRKVWRYAGLQLPRRITSGSNQAGGILDLGKDYRLAEIRSGLPSRLWDPTPIPELKTAIRGPGAPEWRPIAEKPHWRPGIRTGNYGEATPTQNAYQVVYPKNVRARYIQGTNAGFLAYYDADELEARTPVKLEIADMDGDGRPEILAAPDLWPPFLRQRMREDTVLAVLGADGRERFRYQSEQNMQQVRLLDLEGTGRPKVFVLTQDARLRICNADGSLYREDDLYAMHQEFNRTKGRPNTRAPAGGFTMPYSVGLWRPDATGKRRVIVSRYGAYSFIDQAGRFEGLRTAGDYVLARLLPDGVDFDGDGKDEQLCLGKWGMTHLDGDATPVIEEPTGAKFFPQVYATQMIVGPGGAGQVDGTPIRLFETIPFGAAQGPTRFVLVVRESVVNLYDLRTRKAAFSWLPVVSIRAAAVTRSTTNTLVLAVATDSRLLWELTWQAGAPATLAGFKVVSLDDDVNALSADADGALWMGAHNGLYRLTGFDALARVAPGAYQDVRPLSDAGTACVAAVTAAGEVVRFDKKAGPGGQGN